MGAERQGPSPVGATALVAVVPLGKVNQTAVAVVAANLQAIYGLNADVAAARPEPDFALMSGRGQYDASLILERLGREQGATPLRLALTQHDICLTFLNYVFGEALMGGPAAVVSLHRLGDGLEGGPGGRSLLLERVAKVALHETGHMLGLMHCRAPGCLMTFTAGLERLDRLNLSLCPTCQNQLDQSRQVLLAEMKRAATLGRPAHTQ